jgi:hypothetical protein
VSLAELQVRKLVAQLEREEGRDLIPDCAKKVNAAEVAFVTRALRREPDRVILRNGWPDFLVVEKGKTYGVEVKSRSDNLRRDQRATLAALEKAGVPCFVWCPDMPERLVPWRKWAPRSVQTQHSRIRAYLKKGMRRETIAALEGIDPAEVDMINAPRGNQKRRWSP